MADAMSMDDVLNDKVPNEPKVPEQTEKVEAEKPISRRKEHQRREWEAQGRDPDTGQFVKKEEVKEEVKAEEKPAEKVAEKPVEKPAEKPAEKQNQDFNERERALLRAAEEERRKRQDLERRLQALEIQKQPQPEKKSFFEDPDGELARMRQEVQQTAQSVAMQTRLSTSEMIARSKYQDFEAMAEHFKSLAMENPAIVHQMMNTMDPAEFVYKTAKNHKAIQDAGNIDALIEKARAEERAKVAAEMKEKAEKAALEAARERAALPGSLSDTKGTTQKAVQWTGPTSFDSILGR